MKNQQTPNGESTSRAKKSGKRDGGQPVTKAKGILANGVQLQQRSQVSWPLPGNSLRVRLWGAQAGWDSLGY